MRFGVLLLLPLLLLSGCVIDDILGGGAGNETGEEKPPVKISYSSAHVAPTVSEEPEAEPTEGPEEGEEPSPEAEEFVMPAECEELFDLEQVLCIANYTPANPEVKSLEIYGYNISCDYLSKLSIQAGIVRTEGGAPCVYSWSVSFFGTGPVGDLWCEFPIEDTTTRCFTGIYPTGATLHACADTREEALEEILDITSLLYTCATPDEPPPVETMGEEGEPEESGPNPTACEGLDDIHRVVCEAGQTQPIPGTESVTLAKLEVPCSDLRQSSITGEIESSADEACSYQWDVNFRGVKPPAKLQCSSFYIASYTTSCYTTLLPDGSTLHGCSETREEALEKIKEAIGTKNKELG